jgi:putative redox protein
MNMYVAAAQWTEQFRFNCTGNAGFTVPVDGDSKTANSPTDLVLMALCGCTAYDVVSILQSKREPFTAVEVSAEAEKATQSPRVYTEIKLLYKIRGKVSHKAVEDAVRLSEEKYCSVSIMLSKTAKISYRIELDS